METTLVIWQCERCLRFFEPRATDGCGLMSPQPHALRVGIPEMFVCALNDCADVVLARQKEDDKRAMAQRKALADGHRPRPVGNWKNKASTGFERSCPKDTEPIGEVESSGLRVESGPVVGSSQAEFHAAVEVKECNARILGYLQDHYRDWVPMTKLQEVAAVEMVHSRIAEIRQGIPFDHDIDQVNRLYEPTGKVHSHYRLCLKSESERLKRKAEREANEGQTELKEFHE